MEEIVPIHFMVQLCLASKVCHIQLLQNRPSFLLSVLLCLPPEWQLARTARAIKEMALTLPD